MISEILRKAFKTIKSVLNAFYLCSGLSVYGYPYFELPLLALLKEHYTEVFVVYATVSIISMIVDMFRGK